MTFYTIDISRYNGTIDYAKVKAAGIQGVVCKATEGTPAQTLTSTATYFAGAAAGIKRAGFAVRGGYHWLRPGYYAAQASNFYNALVAGYGSLDGLVVQLDAEGSGVTLADVQGFVRSWNALTGSYPLCGYFPKWYWSGLGVGASQLLPLVGGRWWQSAYVTGAGTYLALAERIASGWAPWGSFSPLILQYTSTANVPGDPGVCDVNQTKGTVASFLAVATRVPKPAPIPKPVVTSAEDDDVKVIQREGSAAIWKTDGWHCEHLLTMDDVHSLEATFGARKIVPSLKPYGGDDAVTATTAGASEAAPAGSMSERHIRRAEA